MVKAQHRVSTTLSYSDSWIQRFLESSLLVISVVAMDGYDIPHALSPPQSTQANFLAPATCWRSLLPSSLELTSPFASLGLQTSPNSPRV